MPRSKLPFAAKDPAHVSDGSLPAPGNIPDSQETFGAKELEREKKPEDTDKPDGTTDKENVGKNAETKDKPSVEDKQQANGKPTADDTVAARTKPEADNKPAEKDKLDVDNKAGEKDKPDATNELKANDKADMPGKPDAPDKADNSGTPSDGGKPGGKGEPDGIDKGESPEWSEDVPENPDGTVPDLRNKSGKATEPDTNDDKHRPKSSGKGGMLSLATKQEGKPEEKLAHPSDKPSAADTSKQPTANSALLPPSLIPSSLPVSPQVGVAASTNDGKPSERPKLEGSLPPFRYSGATQELFKKYPRMEVAWVLDREPGGKEPPKVVLEVVLDADGDVQWRNLQSAQRSRFFTDATVSYVLRERIVANSANQLRLGRDSKFMSNALSEAALTSVPPTRMTWGYYRHQSETYELSRAARAFREAADRGIVDFQPQRDDYLEVRWATDSQGDVSISSVRFCPEKGKPLDLPLPKE